MHLEPITLAASPSPFPGPTQHGARGSEARLKVLLLLARHPLGLTRKAVAEGIGLDEQITLYVLTQLRLSGLVACDRHRDNSLWFSRNARIQLGTTGLNRLKEAAERGAA